MGGVLEDYQAGILKEIDGAVRNRILQIAMHNIGDRMWKTCFMHSSRNPMVLNWCSAVALLPARARPSTTASPLHADRRAPIPRLSEPSARRVAVNASLEYSMN